MAGDAKAIFLEAQKHLTAGNADHASVLFDHAASLAPRVWEIRAGQATVALAQGRLGEAEKFARICLSLNPKAVDALLAIGSAAAQQRDYGRALRHVREAIKLAPDYPVAWINLGIIRRGQADLAGALEAFERALSLRDVPLVRWNLAQVQLLAGDLSAGWDNFEARLYAAPSRYFGFSESVPLLWEGQPLVGKRLMLRWEQGLGDTIQMLRYIPRLMADGAEVILDCQKPLAELVANIPGLLKIEATGKDAVPMTQADYWLPLMSLPHRLSERLIQPAAAYLTSPPETARWRAEFAGLPRPIVAIQWRGSALHFRDDERSIPMDKFLAPFGGFQGTLVSIQHETAANETLPAHIHNIGPDLAGFVAPAAVLSAVDHLVTVDTSMAHLAGALGRPVTVLLAKVPDWRWSMTGEYTPWYSTMRLLRQNKAGDWSAPLTAVRRMLGGVTLDTMIG